MASRSVNKVILLGHLGKDAETRFTPQGTAVTSFSVATNRRLKDAQTGEWRDETDWHNIVLWRAENLANYLTKGTQVYLEGRLQTRSYENKEGRKVYVTEVVCDAGDVILVGGRGAQQAGGDYNQNVVSMPRGQSSARPGGAPGGPPADDAVFNQGITDDDVPF